MTEKPYYFEIEESLLYPFGNLRVGQKVQAIINFKVIEKTKTFLVLENNGVFPIPARRKI